MTSVIDKLNAGSAASQAAAAATSSTSSNKATLGEDDFLKLMTTQLQTQDPFNPVDNTQMVAQMAQFSSVAGISEMNQSLSQIAATLNPNRLTDASGWIGRSMLTSSDIATPLGDGSYAGKISLPKAADNVTLSLVDANGTVVHSESLGAQNAGDFNFAWDGKDAGGNVTANGPLKVVVTAKANGTDVGPTTDTWTTIAGIQSPASGGATQLVTPLGLLSPDAALQLA